MQCFHHQRHISGTHVRRELEESQTALLPPITSVRQSFHLDSEEAKLGFWSRISALSNSFGVGM